MRESHNLVPRPPPSIGGGSLGTRLRKSTVWRPSSYNGFRKGEIEKGFFLKGGGGGDVMVYMCKFNYMYVTTKLHIPTLRCGTDRICSTGGVCL